MDGQWAWVFIWLPTETLENHSTSLCFGFLIHRVGVALSSPIRVIIGIKRHESVGPMMGVESCGPRQLCSAQSALCTRPGSVIRNVTPQVWERGPAWALQRAAGSQAVAELRVAAKDSVRHLRARGEETETRGSRGRSRTAAHLGHFSCWGGRGLLPSAALCLRQPCQQDVAPCAARGLPGTLPGSLPLQRTRPCHSQQ